MDLLPYAREWSRPSEFSAREQWFWVFAGDATRKPRILGEGEEVPARDLALVHPVPSARGSERRRS